MPLTRAEALADALGTFNICEGMTWMFCALGILITRGRKKQLDRKAIFLSATFVLFGISDFLETKGWWTPWWLLTMKSFCVIVFNVYAWNYYRDRKKN